MFQGIVNFNGMDLDHLDFSENHFIDFIFMNFFHVNMTAMLKYLVMDEIEL